MKSNKYSKCIKKTITVLIVSFFQFTALDAFAEHHVPPSGPGVSGEQLWRRDLGNKYIQAGGSLSLCQLLGLRPGMQINSVMLVASIQSEPGRSEGSLDLMIDGQRSSREWVGQRIEAIHIWFDRPIFLSQNCGLDLFFNQSAMVTFVGAVVIGEQQPPPSQPALPPSPPPACEVMNNGDKGRRFLIKIRGEVAKAADTVDGLIAALKLLQESGLCTMPERTCKMNGYGSLWMGIEFNYAMRISEYDSSPSQIIVGTNDFDEMMIITSKFVENRICHPVAEAECTSMNGGFSRNGLFTKGIVSIGNLKVWEGYNNSEVGSVVTKLKAAKYCY